MDVVTDSFPCVCVCVYVCVRVGQRMFVCGSTCGAWVLAEFGPSDVRVWGQRHACVVSVTLFTVALLG